MHVNLPRVLLAVATVLVLAACGTDEPAPTAASSTTTTTVPALDASVDWAARTVGGPAIAGYAIAFCEGEAPMLCVTRSGTPAGVLELASYPVASIDALAGGDVTAWADDFAAALAIDRRDGCGNGYEVTADEAEAATFGGVPGVRYRITGSEDGRVVERVVGVAAVVDDQLWLLVGNALEPGGCLAPEGELLVDDLDRLTPALLALAAGSELPRPGTTETGWLRARGAGAVTIDPAELLTGEEAAAARRADGAPEDPVDFYVDDDQPTTREHPVADDVLVELYDCSGGCELRAVPAEDFLAGRAQPSGGPGALVSLVVRDGEVVRISEVYLP